MNAALIGVLLCVLVGIAATRNGKLLQSRSAPRRPCVLARRGRLYPLALRREGVTPEDMFCAVLEAGLESMSEVEWAVLEENGVIAIVRRGAAVRVARRP
jgi:uncharacterized membrane protein YcaP (DUF421 family)